jgi:Tfp pilus assembly protein PilF
MLGELYLRAPAFPVSLGDTALAVDYFRRAVEIAPEQPDNRLGLIEALLAEDLAAEACRQLQHFWQGLTPDDAAGESWKRGLELQGRMCGDLFED